MALLLVFSIPLVAAQEDLLVSPRTWVLGTSAVEAITIHVARPYIDEGVVVEVWNEDDVLVEQFTELYLYEDLRGDLVIKFTPDLENTDKYSVGSFYYVRVEINNKYFKTDEGAIEFEVYVKGTLPSQPNAILTGDKVRGDNGVGGVVQNCYSLYGDCPFGEFDPFGLY
ncbi:MAG: hypothetical protein KKF44_05115 [Nanoarchaeota archaeon]|nr:hypothetical protein [Nanoarchaeota archaeon]